MRRRRRRRRRQQRCRQTKLSRLFFHPFSFCPIMASTEAVVGRAGSPATMACWAGTRQQPLVDAGSDWLHA